MSHHGFRARAGVIAASQQAVKAVQVVATQAAQQVSSSTYGAAPYGGSY